MGISVETKTVGDQTDITITVPRHAVWPMKLDLNFRSKLKACWLILTGREMRISGPFEWKLVSYRCLTTEEVAESFEAMRKADHVISLKHRCDHGVFTAPMKCVICCPPSGDYEEGGRWFCGIHRKPLGFGGRYGHCDACSTSEEAEAVKKLMQPQPCPHGVYPTTNCRICF
jgi:hypothetical protein